MKHFNHSQDRTARSCVIAQGDATDQVSTHLCLELGDSKLDFILNLTVCRTLSVFTAVSLQHFLGHSGTHFCT
jgi:hypothetical protein